MLLMLLLLLLMLLLLLLHVSCCSDTLPPMLVPPCVCAVNPPGYFVSYDAANKPFISPCPADTFIRGYRKQRQCTPW
jgi:hypothetical protein